MARPESSMGVAVKPVDSLDELIEIVEEIELDDVLTEDDEDRDASTVDDDDDDVLELVSSWSKHSHSTPAPVHCTGCRGPTGSATNPKTPPFIES